MKPTWKGSLSIGLVTVPVKLYTSYESEAKLSFNQLHAACGCRINQETVCRKCNKTVTSAEIIKGFEIDKGQYVHMTQQDFDSVKVDSSENLRITHAIPEDELDPIYISSSSFIGPASHEHAMNFAIVREGLSGRVGIGQITLRGREHIVGIKAYEGGIVLHTLYREEEVRKITQVPDFAAAMSQELDPQMVKLAKQVVGTLDDEFVLADFPDRYTQELRAIIEARHTGQEAPVAKVVEAKSPTVDLVAAMKAMLEQAKPKTVKASVKKKAAVKMAKSA
jgi:DNA end-binding protein Ku